MFDSDSDLPWEQDDDSSVVMMTDTPLPLEVVEVDSAHAAEGQQGVTVQIQGGARIAQQIVPVEGVVLLRRLLSRPVPIALTASESEEGGIHGQLIAMVPGDIALAIESEDEPWKASVPRLGEEGGPSDRPVFLGLVVRHAQDRKTPLDLQAEVADLFAAILQGKGKDPVEKMLDSL